MAQLLLPTTTLPPLGENKLLKHGMNNVQASSWRPIILVPLGYEVEVKFNDGNVGDDSTSIYNLFTYDDGGVGGGL